MKKLIVGFIVLLIAIVLGFYVSKDSGYILVSYGSWTIETSLWIGVIILAAIFLLLHIILRLCRETSLIAPRLRRWGRRKKHEKLAGYAQLGFQGLAAGNWAKAEKFLIKSMRTSKAPVINYLGAAHAAQAQHEYARRDDYINKAIKLDDTAKLPAWMTLAKLQLEAKQWPEAQKTLDNIATIAPNHPQFLALQLQLFTARDDLEGLQHLLPKLKKKNVLSESDFSALERKIYRAVLTKAGESDNTEKLYDAWHQLPKYLQRDPDIILLYARLQHRHHQDGIVAPLVKKAVDSQWHEGLVELYGQLNLPPDAKALATAEAWAQKHLGNATLLICLARIAVREQLWGKAKEYLTQAGTISKDPVIHHLFAQVYQALGDDGEALKHYQRAATSF